MSKVLAVLLWVLAIGTALLFVGQKLLFGETLWWFPENISSHGGAIDAQFNRTLWVTGIAFTLAQIALGYAVFRFVARGGERAVYSHGSNRLEVTWTAATAIVFVILAVLGQRVWAQLHLEPAAADAVKVEVVAQQFQFNFHYPGADNTFGRTDPQFINDSSLNFVGLDPADPAGRDDVQVTTLVVPVGRQVELTLRSKDVIHSFFVPQLRIKQDTVPGLNVKIHFTATRPGRYEIPCAELCGQLHYNMKSFMLVLPEDEYQQISTLSEEPFKERMTQLLQQYQ
ncbi:MAG TPA: cytochrome c oxidase subunit II [Blastocatellia bacterium]|nr:cytochrome c oxidase subunit II [Blastocatellia bacterium]